jgi:hypothetical protein
MAHDINLNKKVRKMVMDSDLDSLMPVDCIEILVKYYGEKLEHYSPYVICVLVEKMMSLATDCEMRNEIADAVDTWCNDFNLLK